MRLFQSVVTNFGKPDAFHSSHFTFLPTDQTATASSEPSSSGTDFSAPAVRYKHWTKGHMYGSNRNAPPSQVSNYPAPVHLIFTSSNKKLHLISFSSTVQTTSCATDASLLLGPFLRSTVLPDSDHPQEGPNFGTRSTFSDLTQQRSSATPG